MQQFLQGAVRKDIKSKVYQEEIFETRLFDTSYFGFRKDKKTGPLVLSRFQILGVDIPFDDPDRIRKETQKIKKDFGKKFGNVFVQRGITNELSSFQNLNKRPEEFRSQKKQERENIEHKLLNIAKLRPSLRENMALSTITINAQQDDAQFLKAMSHGSDRHVKKALKAKLLFRQATKDDYESFYHHRYTISQEKGFSIISQENFLRLMDYLTSQKSGELFLVEKEGVMLGGSIVVFEKNILTYLYGFANRHPQFRNVGASHYMRYELFRRARDNGLDTIDMFGGSPSGYPEHDLAGVSRFKESLGGTKIEYFGNYDIVTNPLLYQGIKVFR